MTFTSRFAVAVISTLIMLYFSQAFADSVPLPIYLEVQSQNGGLGHTGGTSCNDSEMRANLICSKAGASCFTWYSKADLDPSGKSHDKVTGKWMEGSHCRRYNGSADYAVQSSTCFCAKEKPAIPGTNLSHPLVVHEGQSIEQALRSGTSQTPPTTAQ